jgi:hypothetical protein
MGLPIFTFMMRIVYFFTFILTASICNAQTFKVDSLVLDSANMRGHYEYAVFEGGNDESLKRANGFSKRAAEELRSATIEIYGVDQEPDFSCWENRYLSDAYWNGRVLSYSISYEVEPYKGRHYMGQYAVAYDVLTQKKVALADLFLPGSEYMDAIWYEVKNMARRQKVSKQIEKQNGDTVTLNAEYLEHANFYLSNNGLCFSMIYENMAFATSLWNGEPYVCVPLSKLRPVLQLYLR